MEYKVSEGFAAFRKAVIEDDWDVIMVEGSFTWLDDVNSMIKGNVSFADKPTQTMYLALVSIFNLLLNSVWVASRDNQAVDIANSQILDAGYILYKVFLELLAN